MSVFAHCDGDACDSRTGTQPFLSFSLLLATMMLLYRLWAANFSDAQITAFHLLVNAVNIVKYFKQVSGGNATFNLTEVQTRRSGHT